MKKNFVVVLFSFLMISIFFNGCDSGGSSGSGNGDNNGGDQPTVYTLTYDANGADSGTVPVETGSPYEPGSTVTVLGNTGSLTKLHANFAGWNTKPDGTGSTYSAAETFTINADTVLYALFLFKAVQSAPAGLGTKIPTWISDDDGKITGLDSGKTYEYKKTSESTWHTAVPGTDISGLSSGRYLVRFAETEFLLASDSTPLTIPPYGAINSLFSVSPFKKVYFSRGNMYYDASATAFKFELNQYATTPEGTGKIGWDSNHVSHFYYSEHTYVAISETYSDTESDTDVLFTNFMADRTKANPYFTVYEQQGKWRTLTGGETGEWNYLFGRDDGNKYGLATIAGTYRGCVLLPDEWTTPGSCTFTAGRGGGYTTNTYTAEQWAAMEEAGAVFLRLAGNRGDEDAILNVNEAGIYASAMLKNSSVFYCILMDDCEILSHTSWYRNNGCSIRLVVEE